jgi:hypothetical protein
MFADAIVVTFLTTIPLIIARFTVLTSEQKTALIAQKRIIIIQDDREMGLTRIFGIYRHHLGGAIWVS